MTGEIGQTPPDGVPKVGEPITELFLNRYEKVPRNIRGRVFQHRYDGCSNIGLGVEGPTAPYCSIDY